ncbi:MAG TPA: SDR family oxidoreductase [Planctomycetaceae bacterium]|nr:SDR family oxidoreductase [Planctomycetaceae bacterium]
MEIRLDGKCALVTGANSGIGAEIAKMLAAAGAKVLVNFCSRPEDAERVVQVIRSAGGEAVAHQTDISNESEVKSMFAAIDDEFGGIDILINNAGIDGSRKQSWEIDPEEWKKVIDVNLMGTFYCSHHALKRMITIGSGVILSISSVHEQIAWSGYSAYTATKAGLSMMTKTMAQEAAPHGVRVLAVAPGAIKTEINKDVWSNQKHLKDLNSKIPLDRIGKVEEVAGMVVVLVSDIASYMTGATVFIDGGMTDYPDFAHGG